MSAEAICPICGEAVKQVASASPELAMWQHWNWVCKGSRLDAAMVQSAREIRRLEKALAERDADLHEVRSRLYAAYCSGCGGGAMTHCVHCGKPFASTRQTDCA